MNWVCGYFLEELLQDSDTVTHPISVAPLPSPSDPSVARDPGQEELPGFGGEATAPHKK